MCLDPDDKIVSINLSVIVPVRNEEANIVSFAERLCAVLPPQTQVFLIYDSFKDSTLDKCMELNDRGFKNLAFHKNIQKPGICGAIRTGFELSHSEWILVIMADLSDQPETIPSMIRSAKMGSDIVIASRYCQGGACFAGPFSKRLLSKVANKILASLAGLPISDFTNAFALYRRSSVDGFTWSHIRGFSYTLSLIHHTAQRGAQITEVPTSNLKRFGGVSKFQILRWLPSYSYWFLQLLVSNISRKTIQQIVGHSTEAKVQNPAHK